MAGGLFLCIELTESLEKGKRFTYAGLGNSARLHGWRAYLYAHISELLKRVSTY